MTFNLVSALKELQQVLDLQQKNLRGMHDPKTEREQGFVTIPHTLQTLEALHKQQPSIVAKDEETVAGYALVMTPACADVVPELFSLYAGLSKLHLNGKPLTDFRFYVMGQVCVAKQYRGTGVFDGLYARHRQEFYTTYDFVITEIATRNTRSMRAHQRVGFRELDRYRDALDEWAVVLWDWK